MYMMANFNQFDIIRLIAIKYSIQFDTDMNCICGNIDGEKIDLIA